MAADSGMHVAEGQAPYRGASPWAFAVKHQFMQADREVLARLPLKDMTLELVRGEQSLWIVAKWPSAGGVVIRTSFSPEAGLVVDKCEREELSSLCHVTSPAGKYRVLLEIPDPEKSTIHFKVWLTPVGELSIPFWPSDTYPVNENGDPIETCGTVHAAQRGSAMGFVYASLTDPQSGSFLYFQDLTSLNDLCEQTEAVPENRMGGSWPELGYTPPIAERMPLHAGTEIILSDGYICFSPAIPGETGELAHLFLDMLAEIYVMIPRPEARYRDWAAMAGDSARDLEHPDCIATHHGLRYLNAYVGTGDRRPESLVQLAVALPLLEYQEWSGKKIPLIEEIIKTLPSFFYDDIGCIMRYPNTMKDQEGADADEKGAYEVDSWYLYHPLINLARLAQRGYKEAEQLLFDSVEYAIKVAHHFEYRWPVIFDANTLEPVRESPTRELGETDVAALYAYLMLRMHELSGEDRFMEEARKAAEDLKGLHFNLGYQFNNAAWGANALAKLWRETGSQDYLSISYMCIASILQNAFIWDCNYGFAKHYSLFFGITPLREGPYVAAYEELEIFAAFHEYLGLVDAHVAPSVHLLLSEYCKYVSDNKICMYPRNLPEDVITDQPQNGHINRDLTIPLEDLYQGWEKAGQVGQEVYGAGMAPGIVTRCLHHVDGAPFLLYCQYPVHGLCAEPEERSCKFAVYGDRDLGFTMRLVPKDNETLSGVAVRLVDAERDLEGRRTDEGQLEYDAPGGSRVELRW